MLQAFNERLRREWSIETGIIERLYTIDRGTTQFVITRDHREEYIRALEKADDGDLSHLVRLFDRVEKRAYILALDLSEDVLQTGAPVLEIIDSIAERYQKKHALDDQKRDRALRDRVFTVVAKKLQESANEVMSQYVGHMQQRFQQAGLPIEVAVDLSEAQAKFSYNERIEKVAKELGYVANLARPSLWVRLSLVDTAEIMKENAEIVVAFHYIGKEDHDVMMATAFLNKVHLADTTKGFDFDSVETRTIVSDGFVFAYTDAELSDQRQKEFRQWLERAIAVGLAEWQKQL